jgi:hypothetical protein
MRTRTLRGSLTLSSAWQLSLACCTTLALALAGCATGSSGGGDDRADDDDVPQRADAGPHDPDADLTQPDARPGDPDAEPEDIDADVPGAADAHIDPPADPDLIDNLDDGNDHIVVTPTRRGSWYTFHDESDGGVQVPGDSAFTLAAGGATASSAYYVRTTGSGFTDWGAGVGFDLNAGDSGPKGKFNATAYTGISFKAKGNVTIRFAVQIAAVLETTLGGTCVPSTTPMFECDDTHGTNIALTSTWATYQVPFNNLVQEMWGLPAMFSKTTLTAVVFQFLPSASFDVSIDDVRFY